MKRYIGLAFLIAALQLSAQGDFEVNKEVEGISTKIHQEGRELKEDLADIDINSIDFKDIDIDTNIDFEKEVFDIDKISEDFSSAYDFLEDEVKSGIDSFINKRNNNNYLYFGFGAFDQIDGLEYGLQYSDSYEDLKYRIKLNRDIKGEDRKNSNESLDSLQVDLAYNKFDAKLHFNRLDENYPGMVTSPTQVESSRNLVEIGTSLSYKLLDQKEDSSNIVVDIYHADSDSVSLSTSDYTRTWKNTSVDLYATYEKLVKNSSMSHLLEAKFGYLYDDMHDGKSGTLYLEGRDRFKLDTLPDVDFKSGLAIESSSKKTRDDEFNFSADIEASKKIDENLSIFALAKKDNRTKSAREIRDGFDYVNDIVAFSDLSAEDNYVLSLGANFTQDKLFLEAYASYIRSEDKVYYEQVASDPGRENSIAVKNATDTYNWFDLGFKGTYIVNEGFRGELNFLYTTLDELSYIPTFKGALSAVYEIEKYETKAVFNYNGDMYANINKQNKLDSYVTVDWLNVYNFSNNISTTFGIENLFDASEQYMTGYPIDGRRYTLRFNMKY